MVMAHPCGVRSEANFHEITLAHLNVYKVVACCIAHTVADRALCIQLTILFMILLYYSH